jgi:hypothetical protein
MECKGLPKSYTLRGMATLLKIPLGSITRCVLDGVFMSDKPFVAGACNIGVRQKAHPNLHIWQIRRTVSRTVRRPSFACVFNVRFYV